MLQQPRCRWCLWISTGGPSTRSLYLESKRFSSMRPLSSWFACRLLTTADGHFAACQPPRAPNCCRDASPHRR
jgi:hypothetical protein